MQRNSKQGESNMYKYETHLHTYPVSKCAKADVCESLDCYKKMGYDGVFVTNHFINGNINLNADMTYEEKINFYFSDYEKALEYGKKTGIKVFLGIEITTYRGTDFLVYGPDKNWFLKNKHIMDMSPREQLEYFMNNGFLVVHAHPYREADYIECIRLFPRSIHGVEIENACRTEFENKMAKLYCENYGFIPFGGTDNHVAGNRKNFAGMCSKRPIENEEDFITAVQSGEMEVFTLEI